MRTGRRIFKNIFSLSLAEVANKGITLIYFTYLARILLPEGFGVLNWATAFVVYFVYLVDLGFGVVGPREIARYPDKIKRYVNNITSIKLSSSIILYTILTVIVIFINKPDYVKYLLLISGLNIFANAILLNWVFQGIEKMEIIAIRQVTTSLLNLAGIILLVHSPDDIIIAMSVIIASMLINSTWMFFYYIKSFGGIKFEYNYNFWKELLSASVPVSLTMFIAVLYNNLSIFLLGILSPHYEEAGIYAAAYRIFVFTMVPTGILQNAFIPQLSRSVSLEEKRKFTEKYVLFTFLAGTIISAGFFTYSDFITGIFGAEFKESSLILKLLMIAGLFAFINVSYNSPLLSWKYEKKIFIAMSIGGIVNIILNIALIPYYGSVGAAIAAISTEFSVCIGLSFIMYGAIKKLYLDKFVLVLLYAVVSCGIGFWIMTQGLHPIISGTISLIIFILINFILKTLTLAEIKLYLRKN
jgi:O-antigen/teichoic acid export membrane protein